MRRTLTLTILLAAFMGSGRAQDSEPAVLSSDAFAKTPGWTTGADKKTLRAAPDAKPLQSKESFANYVLSFDYQLSNPAQGKASVELDSATSITLPPSGKHIKIAFRHDADGRRMSQWLDGKQTRDNAEVEDADTAAPESVAATGSAWWMSSRKQARKDLDFSAEFTVAVRFRTKGSGTLVAKCPPQGKWVESAKALFVRDGRLTYDIGWVGEIKSRVKVNDARWHNAVLTCRGGVCRMLVDGKLQTEKGGFSRKDAANFVFKIGDANDDFGGPFSGDIEYVRFWKRALPEAELKALGDGKPEATNTPLLNWIPEPGKKYGANPKTVPGKAEPAVATKASPYANPITFRPANSDFKLSNITITPLAEVDHARLIRELDDQSLVRGARIYNGLCITCHGTPAVEGTLPTALRFHQGEFKNGKDPYRMFQTLTTGFNQMVAQPWMTARQKYDVIHYVRETFLKANNPGQFTKIDDAYLDGLPVGLGTGSDRPTMFADDDKAPRWKRMNYGPALFWTLEVAGGNIAYKAIAVRLDEGVGGVSKGNLWLVYDHDTMRVAAAYGGAGFVNWRGIAFDQSHGSHTAIIGDKAYVNPVGPGWAKPGTGSFEDPRFLGRDGKPYGPLPRAWTQYKGAFLHGNRMIINYTVGDAKILELPGYEKLGDTTAFTRTMDIGKSPDDLLLRVAPDSTAVATKGGGELFKKDGFHLMRIKASATPLRIKLLTGAMEQAEMDKIAAVSGPAIDMANLMKGGPKRWPETVETEGVQSEPDGALVSDEIKLPVANPWNSWMRLGGFDFFADGKRAAVATWLGDVWIVDGIDGEFGRHQWKRIATGLFQPLGVKVVDGKIFVTCRDQLVKLHDLNGDEEIDYYECFNNDHQVTEHFHEFAMGLQTDDEGNFYYAKSARHAKTALVPHHGTLLKVSKDGSETEILATGFRAANGVCINPDGTFIVTDQEGHWNPKNRINWVRRGGFYGNMYGYHDVTDSSDEAMSQPLCWITNRFDRSPGELLWVKNSKWGPLEGSLLNLSYGMGRVFLVPHETLNGQVQGGMVSIGFDFPTGTMRGRFHPQNGQLYTTGMFAWAGSKSQDGGFYRIRYTGKPVCLPIGLEAKKTGLKLTFSDKLDPAGVNAGNFSVRVWGLRRTKNYGSPHVNEHALKIDNARLSADGKSVFLTVPDIAATWCMEIKYNLRTADGKEIQQTIHNTIHALGQ